MTETNKQRAILSESTYKKTKGLVQIGLPLTSSSYFALSRFWELPATEGVIGGLAILALVLGIALRTSSDNYYNSPYGHDGEMVVIADGGGVRTFSLEVNGDPDDLALKNVITFKVRKTNAPEPPIG